MVTNLSNINRLQLELYRSIAPSVSLSVVRIDTVQVCMSHPPPDLSAKVSLKVSI